MVTGCDSLLPSYIIIILWQDAFKVSRHPCMEAFQVLHTTTTQLEILPLLGMFEVSVIVVSDGTLVRMVLKVLTVGKLCEALLSYTHTHPAHVCHQHTLHCPQVQQCGIWDMSQHSRLFS